MTVTATEARQELFALAEQDMALQGDGYSYSYNSAGFVLVAEGDAARALFSLCDSLKMLGRVVPWGEAG